MAPKYPAIPEPTTDVQSLRDTVLSIKQFLEILTGQRGNPDYAAASTVDISDVNDSIDDANAAIATKVAKAGDTMTGLLTLSADPSTALQAATKQYADTKVAKAGDTMTGALTLPGNPSTALQAAPKQYVDSAPNAVRYDAAQSLTAAQQAQARVNARASSMDATAFQNLIINGGMECDQQNSGAATSLAANSFRYPVDQWVIGLNHAAATAAATGQRGVGGSPVGPYYLSFNCSTALTSPAGGDYAYIGQWIEGYRCNKLWWGTSAAQTLTLSFWVYSNVTGTASISIRNSAGDRSYVTTFATTSGQWLYYTKTIPGCPTGTWLGDTGIGISVLFFFACGTTNQTSSTDTWISSGAFAVTGQQNYFATAGNFIGLSGVTLVAGNELPPQDQYAYARLVRPMPDELILSQRYWQKLDLPLVGFYSNGASHNRYDTFPYLNEMRVAPTVGTLVSPSTLTNVSSWTVGSGGQIGTKSLRADLFAAAAGVCYAQGGIYSLSARLV